MNQGLSDKEVKNNLKQFGYNEIEDKSPLSPLKILIRQFKGNLLIYTLCVGAILSLLVGKTTTGYSIFGVVILIIITSFIQEFRAEKAVKALKDLIVPLSTVIRGGKQIKVPSRELVPDDILILATGDRIPADAVILNQTALRVDESILTGESEPITKAESIEGEDNIDNSAKLFMGTFITEGKCTAKVIKTGMSTEFGKIAEMVSKTEKDMPLQRKVDKIAKYMAIVALVAAVANGILLMRGYESLTGFALVEILIVVIALAVSAIPEGLPVVLTTTLATGSYRMAKKNAVINRMSVIETLGETTVICSDKTGTLTTGKMTATKIFANNIEYNLSADKLSDLKNIELLAKACVLCNDAHMDEEKKKNIIGSPTETALLSLAYNLGFSKAGLNTTKRIDEIPFSSERKKMIVVCEENGERTVYSKGAAEFLLKDCSFVQLNGEIEKLSSKVKESILLKLKEFSQEGLRSVAIAFKKEDDRNMESDLVFLGVVGIQDPPRLDVRESINACFLAGIKVKMITGDNLHTAEAIAKQIGIEGKAIEGKDIDLLSDNQLSKIVEETVIYARVRPEHKLRIVKALKKNGEIVTMTGDGINDAPALKESHIGVAMGKNGTDVTRSIADMTLKDDNFATIVEAIKEGRTIFSNIRKFVTYQLSCNFAQLSIVFIGTAMGLPLPLVALQILFINLIVDVFPSMSLGFNPPSSYVMTTPPRKNSELIDIKNIRWIVGLGLIMVVGTIGVYYYFLRDTNWNVEVSRTMAFLTFVLFATVNSFNFKSFHIPTFRTSIFSNKYLFIAGFASVSLAYLIVNTPIGKYFDTVPIPIYHWEAPALLALSIIVIADIVKAISGRKTHAGLIQDKSIV